MKYLMHRLYHATNSFNRTAKIPIINLLIVFHGGIIGTSVLFVQILTLLWIIIFVPTRKMQILCIICLGGTALFMHTWEKTYQTEKSIMAMYIESYATIVEPPDEGFYTDQAIVNIEQTTGHALVELPQTHDWQYGDSLWIEGTLTHIRKRDKPFETGYAGYLESKQVWHEINVQQTQFIARNKTVVSFFSSIQQGLVTAAAPYVNTNAETLANGTLLGKKDTIDDNTKEILQRTGTSHIISASGFNVLIIYAASMMLLGVIPKKLLYVLSIIGIGAYLLLIGIYILPAIRAGVMLITIILSRYLGRKIAVLQALLFSTAIILLIYPYSWQNISFQLSVAATIGLLQLTPHLTSWLHLKNMPKEIKEGLLATIAATIATIPITITTFGSFSIIAVIANVLVTPLVPIIMLLSGIGLITALLIPSIFTTFIYTMVNTISDIFMAIVTFLSKLQFSYTENTTLIAIIVLCVCISIIIADRKQVQKHLNRVVQF